MKIFKNKQEVRRELLNINDLYFVPTMGSLHNGHISLIKKAKKNNNKKRIYGIFSPEKSYAIVKPQAHGQNNSIKPIGFFNLVNSIKR